MPCLPTYPLEIEFGAELAYARVARRGHQSKLAAAEIAVGICELGVIEDIEEFKSQFKGCSLCNSRSLHQPHIKVVNTWSMEELTR